MSENNTIYYLQHKDIQDKDILINEIYANTESNYYFSDDFSKDFYTDLCYFGFISTTIIDNDKLFLLPEIQFEYALLYFENLHISKKVKKLINKKEYIFEVDSNIKEVLNKLDEYHNPNWLIGDYKNLLIELFKDDSESFKIKTFLVKDKKTKEIIAGEIGYKIGNTYTSLTGFSSKEKKYNNYGTLQLILTAKYLEKENYKLWNLGHPYMEYKYAIGAKRYRREEFLERWYSCM
ncbi:hypothetical protein [Arcobacter roscoffensis]|uniref:Leucyl/phenylalanyl-tRNA--protein transferase n=1 Tax=Arcobacter roscoffensis TaxID=2961520 RepID=A0ABY5E3P5_9BACT|nr:hypothetical protein [Arcobacter roscoffensis]UTJ06769.1 hypothetical protein NJU99_01410 [Arcobacter roscoffensis]